MTAKPIDLSAERARRRPQHDEVHAALERLGERIAADVRACEAAARELDRSLEARFETLNAALDAIGARLARIARRVGDRL